MLTATDHTTIPAVPGPGQEDWRCDKCGNMLGVIYAGWLFVRYKGRLVASHLPARIQCEGCGKRNMKGE